MNDTSSGCPLAGKHVLLVETNDALFGAMRDALHEAGCTVIGSLGAEMPTMFPETLADAAVVDLDYDPAVGEIMTAFLTARRIPTVVIAAEELAKATARGCIHLAKPFTEHQLVERMIEAVASRAEAS